MVDETRSAPAELRRRQPKRGLAEITDIKTIAGGVRHEHFSDFGNTTNPRLALVWQTRQDLTTKLMYGRAFRAPAFWELYLVNAPFSYSNRNLKPETMDTVELAFDYRPRDDLR